MAWFKRQEKGISTPTEQKKETPDGLWWKCPECKTVATMAEHKRLHFVCGSCCHHDRIDAADYFELLFDEGQFTELDADLTSGDPLRFVDTKAYPQRVAATEKSTGLKDAVRTAHGVSGGQTLVVAAMDFKFIGGSMGSVVGETIARAIDYARQTRTPFPP
jgi:acetyl-CoA carboxylase carboxyl transferase subunit beta